MSEHEAENLSLRRDLNPRDVRYVEVMVIKPRRLLLAGLIEEMSTLIGAALWFQDVS